MRLFGAPFYFLNGVVSMDVIKWVTHEDKPAKKIHKKQEKLTEKDIEELMGIHKPRYTRKRGAVRQK